MLYKNPNVKILCSEWYRQHQLARLAQVEFIATKKWHAKYTVQMVQWQRLTLPDVICDFVSLQSRQLYGSTFYVRIIGSAIHEHVVQCLYIVEF